MTKDQCFRPSIDWSTVPPILISACLLGRKVRYSGSDAATGHALLLHNWLKVFNEHQLDEAQAFLLSLDNA
jgi:hypothetical protein